LTAFGGSDFEKRLSANTNLTAKPGQSRITTQRKEADTFGSSSGAEGKDKKRSIAIVIYNEDQRSKDYGHISDKFRPSHADHTLHSTEL
jgi:chorismate synthase